MPTFTALTTLTGKDAAEALGEAMETLIPEPYGVGVFEIEDGSGLWEVGGYFNEAPDVAGLALLAAMHQAKDFTVSELPDVDWALRIKRHFLLYFVHKLRSLWPWPHKTHITFQHIIYLWQLIKTGISYECTH